MKIGLIVYSLVVSLASSKCEEEPELPLCPTNIQYLPQNLPMHCRMPRNAKFPGLPEQMGRQMFPPFPGPGNEPPSFPLPPLPAAAPAPAAGPMPMPMMSMPLPGVAPAPKVPVIVMPFYSPDPMYKKPSNGRRPPFHKRPSIGRPYLSDTSSDTDTDTSSDFSSDSSDERRGIWKSARGFRRNGRRLNRRHKKRKHSRRQLLTPVLQYVTKDGYVIYEKKISNNEAKDWVKVKKDVLGGLGGEGNEQMTEAKNFEAQFQGQENDEGDEEVETEKTEKIDEEPEEVNPTNMFVQKRRGHRVKTMSSNHLNSKKKKNNSK